MGVISTGLGPGILLHVSSDTGSNCRLNFSGEQYDGTKRLHYENGDVSSFFGQGAFSLMGAGKSLVGIIEGCSVPQLFIPQLLDYYKKGMFPFDKLITYYDFDDIERAFEDTRQGKAVKAILKME
jgi:Zn-dependent alcohol dehydrogenase